MEDSWTNLLQMLLDGEIDLLSDVSYTEERSQSMLYSSLPMGEEAYYLFIDADRSAISSEDRPKLGPGRQLTVAINEGNRNYETFLKDSIPDWTVQTYSTGLD